MRGIGGPLLCIGDLLSDVGDEGDAAAAAAAESRRRETPSTSSPSSLSDIDNASPVPDLTKLFQENYEHLNSALAGTDQSWTSLTLKLCSALETANQLVQSTNSNAASLSQKVGELQEIVKRADSAVAAARAVYIAMANNNGSSIDIEGGSSSRTSRP